MRCSAPTARGLDLALAAVLPVFLICSASMSVGLMRRLADETAAHLQRTQLRHLGQSLAQQVQPRAELARLRIEADRTWALVADTLAAVEAGRADAQLLVLEVKAAAGEAAADAADLALRAGGGAAFRKESASSGCSATPGRHGSWHRRRTRSTTSSGARCAACRCSGTSRDRLRQASPSASSFRTAAARRGRLRPQGRHDLGRVPAWLRGPGGLRLRLRPVLELRAPGRGPGGGPHRRGLELAAGLGPRPAAGARRAASR